MNPVRQTMLDDLAAAAPRGLEPLLDALKMRYGDQLLGVLLYGSCRRQDQLGDGLVDLLVLVSGYRDLYGTGPSALFNWLLPPNVYYLEAGPEQGRLRSKYAVITPAQFCRRCRNPIDLYFWARFSQPCRLVFARSPGLAGELADARAVAARFFARRVLPLAGPATTADSAAFWTLALATTYRCELRPEPPQAARRLIAADPVYWSRLSSALAISSAPTSTGLHKAMARGGWLARRLSGKLFNLARLFKAAGTFSNGIDYIVWKVERHSGVRVEPSERMRRYPRLAAWGLAWRMWRQGGFR
ncbi:MAG: hypothetical protein EA419_05185 [Wenzhouxiangella sp.]|nr:MAG: hypothetical protein EA419_05185 [Wenzhouxiangella sp.]